MNYRRLRTPLLVAHIATSVGFLGAVAVFFCLALTGLMASDVALANASYAVMPRITWAVIVPLAAVSLAVGILQSALSPWGLIRHYWVVVKFTMTVVIAVVLVLQMGTIERLGDAGIRAAIGSAESSARYSVLLHSGAGLVALLVTLVLSVAKPKGSTGWSPAE